MKQTKQNKTRKATTTMTKIKSRKKIPAAKHIEIIRLEKNKRKKNEESKKERKLRLLFAAPGTAQTEDTVQYCFEYNNKENGHEHKKCDIKIFQEIQNGVLNSHVRYELFVLE